MWSFAVPWRTTWVPSQHVTVTDYTKNFIIYYDDNVEPRKYVSQLKLTNNLQNDTNKFYYDDQC